MLILTFILITFSPFLSNTFNIENTTHIIIIYSIHIALIIILEHLIIYIYKVLTKTQTKDLKYQIKQLENKIIYIEEKINNVENKKTNFICFKNYQHII